MTILLCVYRVTFHGHRISSWLATYTAWERLKARLLNTPLSEIIYGDEVTYQLSIQGPDKEFIEREFAYRRAYTLERMQRQAPQATITMSEADTQWVPYLGAKPRRDFSPSQSPEFQAWVATFNPPPETPHD